MKLIYCIPQLYNAGGMERVLTQKVNFLAEQGDYEVIIVTTERTPQGLPCTAFPLHQAVRVVELNICFDEDFRKPLPAKWYHHRCKQQLYRKALTQVVHDEKADLLISLCGKEIEWLGQAQLPCKTMAELHFAMGYRAQLLHQYHKGFLWDLIGRWMTRDLVRNARKAGQLVVLTKADEEAWKKQGVTNVRCIPNPCCLTPDNSGSHQEKTVLAVGRLHPQKGFDLLICAWHIVHQQHSDWQLHIAGEGDERPRLEQQIRELQLEDTILLKGKSNDIQADYRNCGLFVLSSRYEGLPLALMEAMSQACCCISFDCPQGPAELIDDNRTGQLLPAGDVNRLAETICNLIDQPDMRFRMGEAACEEAEKRFGLPHIMQQWQQLFFELCA